MYTSFFLHSTLLELLLLFSSVTKIYVGNRAQLLFSWKNQAFLLSYYERRWNGLLLFAIAPTTILCLLMGALTSSLSLLMNIHLLVIIISFLY